MTDVLIAGVAVADIIMRVADLPRSAEKYRAEDAHVTVGGCAANAAIAVARHGGKARLAARLGKDVRVRSRRVRRSTSIGRASGKS